MVVYLLRLAISEPGSGQWGRQNERYDVTVGSQGDQLDVWLCEVSDGLYRKSTPEGIFNRGSTGGIYLLALPFLLFPIRQCPAINIPGWPGLQWSLGKLDSMLVFHLRCNGKKQTSGICLRQWVHCGSVVAVIAVMEQMAKGLRYKWGWETLRRCKSTD